MFESKNYKKIMQFFNSHRERPYSPKEVAIATKLSPNTVKSYLRRLNMSGFLDRPFPKFYKYAETFATKPTYGVGTSEPLPRVHNLDLSLEAEVKSHWEESFGFGDSKIRVQGGMKRNLITAKLSSKSGLDYNAFCLSMEKFFDVIQKRYGLRPDPRAVKVKGMELNLDYKGIRLDGVQCITLYDFKGSLERIYNKPECLRSEVKVEPQSVESIIGLLKGGMTTQQIVQGIGFITKNLEAKEHSDKLLNQNIYALTNLVKVLIGKLDKWLEKENE